MGNLADVAVGSTKHHLVQMVHSWITVNPVTGCHMSLKSSIPIIVLLRHGVNCGLSVRSPLGHLILPDWIYTDTAYISALYNSLCYNIYITNCNQLLSSWYSPINFCLETKISIWNDLAPSNRSLNYPPPFAFITKYPDEPGLWLRHSSVYKVYIVSITSYNLYFLFPYCTYFTLTKV